MDAEIFLKEDFNNFDIKLRKLILKLDNLFYETNFEQFYKD